MSNRQKKSGVKSLIFTPDIRWSGAGNITFS